MLGIRPPVRPHTRWRFALLGVLLASCAPATPPAASSHTLRIGVPDGVTALSPYAGAADDWLAAGTLYEGLVAVDSTDTVQPALASRWVQQDSIHYRFIVRSGVQFTDGTPLTAAAIVAAWTAALTSPDSATALGGGLMALAGAHAVARGQSPTLVGARAVDDTTLDLTLDGPRVSFLTLLAGRAFDVWRPGTPPVGTGPWRYLDGLDRGSALSRRVRFVRHPGYWGTPAHYDTLVLQYVPPEAFTSAIVDRAVDCAPLQTYRQRRGLSTDARVILPPAPPINLTRIIFNHRSPKLRELAVRQALLRVIDVDELTALFLLRDAPRWRSALPASVGDTVTPPFPLHDAAAARVLRERLDPTRDTLIITTFSESTGDGGSTLASAVAAQLRRAGIPARAIPTPGFESTAGLGRVDLSIETWYPTTLDVESFLVEHFHSTDASPYANSGQFADATLDALIEQLRRTTNVAERRRLAAQADRRLAEQAALLPLWREPMMVAHHRAVAQCVMSPSRTQFLEARPAGDTEPPPRPS